MVRILLIISAILMSTPIIGQTQKASDKGSELGSIIPVGVMLPYAGITAPTGWVFAYGQQVSQTGTYAKLYAAISTTYCTADHGGTCTGGNFRLPDLRGRVVGGKDNMGGSSASRITSAKTIDGTVLGKTGGVQNIPGHYHGMGTGATAATTLGISGGGPYTNQSHYHNAGDNMTASLISNGGSQMVYKFRATPTWTATGTFSTSVGSISSDFSNGININGQTGTASADIGTVSLSGSNSVGGSIGLVTGGCDGNTDACDNLQPIVITNYIIKY